MKAADRGRYTAEFKTRAVGVAGSAECADRERRPTSPAAAGRGGRSERTAHSAARKCGPASRERHFKKGGNFPGNQNPQQNREMILLVAQKSGASIRQVCDVLKVPRSSFYTAAKPSATALADTKIGDVVESVFRTHRRRYTAIGGSRRRWPNLTWFAHPPEFGGS